MRCEKRIESVGRDAGKYFVVNNDRHAYPVASAGAEAACQGHVVFQVMRGNRGLEQFY